jgi:hypothetical protein
MSDSSKTTDDEIIVGRCANTRADCETSPAAENGGKNQRQQQHGGSYTHANQARNVGGKRLHCVIFRNSYIVICSVPACIFSFVCRLALSTTTTSGWQFCGESKSKRIFVWSVGTLSTLKPLTNSMTSTRTTIVCTISKLPCVFRFAPRRSCCCSLSFVLRKSSRRTSRSPLSKAIVCRSRRMVS